MSDADAFDAADRLPARALAVLPREGDRARRRSTRSRRLPLTDKSEIRATISAEHPFGTHLAADAGGDRPHPLHVSGTTGVPSYIPLTAQRPRQLGHRQLPELRGVGAEPRHARDHHLQRRPVRRRRRARVVRPHRRLPHPDGDRQHRARADGDRAPEARRRRRHAVLREVPGRDRRSRATRASPRCSSPGEPGGGEPGFRAASRRRPGARRSPRRWGSATSASRCGASASTRTACTWARTASSTPS